MFEIKRITILCAGYPTPVDPTMLPFIDQLVCAWADMGLEVNVICPIMKFIEFKNKNKFYKDQWVRKTDNGNEFCVYHPRYYGFGVLEAKNNFLYRLAYSSFQKAIKKEFDKLQQSPDILYSHFLTSGVHAGDLSEQYGIPSFCAFGESTLWSVNSNDKENIKKSLRKLNGIISVSSENKEKLVQSGLILAENICVIPNAVNTDIFFQHDKATVRKKYGFPADEFIGIFVGTFSSRKGLLRTQEAAKKAGTKMIYIGSGDEDPVGDNVLFKGKVPHALIAEYLSAADFFVLPTRAEGCCNAIIEAIACGLPVISSNGRFNDDILADDYSIRVNPDDINAITKAILTLKEDQFRRDKMSQAAVKAGKQFDIRRRAVAIIDYMSRKTQEG